MSVLNMLLSAGLLSAICFIIAVVAKVVIVFRITDSRSRKLSDESIKALAKMMSHDITTNFKR